MAHKAADLLRILMEYKSLHPRMEGDTQQAWRILWSIVKDVHPQGLVRPAVEKEIVRVFVEEKYPTCTKPDASRAVFPIPKDHTPENIEGIREQVEAVRRLEHDRSLRRM